jgi:hypothetical protein
MNDLQLFKVASLIFLASGAVSYFTFTSTGSEYILMQGVANVALALIFFTMGVHHPHKDK